MTKTVHNVVAAVKDITELVDHRIESVESRQSQEVVAIAEEISAGAEEVTARKANKQLSWKKSKNQRLILKC